jgi:hypothetical protein
MRAPPGGIAVVVIAVSFGLVGAALVRNVDTLAGDIRAAIEFAPLKLDSVVKNDDGTLSGSLDLVIVHGPPTGAARGIQIAILTILLGGVPAAILALVLGRRVDTHHHSWPAAWSQLFLAGFVFQLSNLLFSSLFFVVFALDVGLGTELDWQSVIFTGVFLANVVCSAAALRSWRVLRASAWKEMPTLALE